jgi:hypothetical protein
MNKKMLREFLNAGFVEERGLSFCLSQRREVSKLLLLCLACTPAAVP